jgi:hypothetical protein
MTDGAQNFTRHERNMPHPYDIVCFEGFIAREDMVTLR